MSKDIYQIFESFRNAETKLINEAAVDTTNSNDNGNADCVPYSTQDEVMTSSLEAAKTQFGADFSDFKTPMLYYPKDGDIVLSGSVSSLNNAKFQFRYKDPTNEGCFVWIEPIQLTEANLNELKKIYGVFKNWKKSLDSTDDKKPIGLKQE